MKTLTGAQLFAPAKRARKTKARLDRAKLLIVKARERAAVTAQRYAAQPSAMYRAAEAPIGRKVQREVLTGRVVEESLCPSSIGVSLPLLNMRPLSAGGDGGQKIA